MIINFGVSTVTPAQESAGVIDMGPDDLAELKQMLKFCSTRAGVVIDEPFSDSKTYLKTLSISLARLAVKAAAGRTKKIMIGDVVPRWLISHVVSEMKTTGLEPLFSVVGESHETIDIEGVPTRIVAFDHRGFVAV